MIEFAKAIAANTDLESAQAFVFSSEDTYLAVLISAEGDDIFTAVRQLSSELEEFFFSSAEPIPQRLNTSLDFIKEKLKAAEELKIMLSSWKSDIIYLQGLGGGRVYLYRNSQVTPLIGENQSGQLISGYIKPGDKLLFLNEAANGYVTGSEGIGLNKLFEQTTDTFEEEINSLVLNNPNPNSIAAILIDNKIEQVEVSQETTSENVPEAIPNLEETAYAQNPKATFQNLLQKASPFLKEFSLRIKAGIPKTAKGRLYLAIALLAVIFLGIGLSIKSKGDAAKNSQFQSFLLRAKDEYSQAQNLKDLDSDQAKEALGKSRNDLKSALVIKPDNKEALDLKSEIDQNSNSILKVTNVTDWPLFLDLNLIKNSFSTKRISLSLSKILLLDSNQKTLVSVDLDKKTNTILAGTEQLGQANFASLNGSFGFVYSSDKGVIRVDTQSVKSSVAAKVDSDWGGIADLYGFGGNIYLLDSIKGAIWKYTPTQSGFSGKIPYLKNGVKADFSGAKRMLIDSSVWVLKPGSEIDKFTSGSPDSFSVGGLDKSLNDVRAFFVSDETDNIYLLDSGNSRVVVLKKNGQYVSQLTGDKFKSADDLVVDEKGKKLYLLENNKIYQISLP